MNQSQLMSINYKKSLSCDHPGDHFQSRYQLMYKIKKISHGYNNYDFFFFKQQMKSLNNHNQKKAYDPIRI